MIFFARFRNDFVSIFHDDSLLLKALFFTISDRMRPHVSWRLIAAEVFVINSITDHQDGVVAGFFGVVRPGGRPQSARRGHRIPQGRASCHHPGTHQWKGKFKSSSISFVLDFRHFFVRLKPNTINIVFFFLDQYNLFIWFASFSICGRLTVMFCGQSSISDVRYSYVSWEQNSCCF